jgi:sulfatase modifying factor 1
MNLTSQYIVNQKSKIIYSNSKASYKSICSSTSRLRLNDAMISLKPNRMRKIQFKIGEVCFDMIHCPRGKFMMGSDNRYDNNPKRPIAIERPFLLGETEVTHELFKAVMGYNPSNFQGQGYPNSNQRPVEQVTWYDALMFCNKLSLKLGKRPYYIILNEKYEKNKPNIGSANVTTNPNSNGFRLPYEKEWEYAAKAGTNNKYAGTNDVNQVGKVAWFDKNSENQTHPVKGKQPNEWGFYDMSGNVEEWCYDLYSYTSVDRVYRGGSWSTNAWSLCSAFRLNFPPGYRTHNIGFRVSASLVN